MITSELSIGGIDEMREKATQNGFGLIHIMKDRFYYGKNRKLYH